MLCTTCTGFCRLLVNYCLCTSTLKNIHSYTPTPTSCPPSPRWADRYTHTESVERFIEDQAFLRSYDSAPRPPPSPFSHQQVVSLSQSSCVTGQAYWRGGGGGGWGGGLRSKPYDSEKVWPSINHSILSANKSVKVSYSELAFAFYTFLEGWQQIRIHIQ